MGYHAIAGDRSMLTYSRDAMADPLRQLEQLFDDIRVKEFLPDSTRSGHFNNDLTSRPTRVRFVIRVK